MRIDSLTFFRFAAAVIVLFFHFGRETDLVAMWSPFIVSGPAMVTFFFTLSGFVMLISHYHKTNLSLRKYYVARIARIFPIYVFALFFTAFLVLGYGINDIYSLVLSFFFMQSWVSPYPTAMNTPGWSLSVEVFFYVSFPIIIWAIRKHQPRTSFVVLFTLAVYFVTQIILSRMLSAPDYSSYPSFLHDMVNYFPLSHLCSFLMGITGGLICIRYPQYFTKTGLHSYLVLFAAFYLTYFLLQNRDFIQGYIDMPLAYGSSFYTWLALTLIMSIAYAKNRVTDFFSSRFMVFLGDISLSVYILQKPMHIVYIDYISDALALGPNADFYVFCTLLIATGCVTHLTIEKLGSKAIFKINKMLPDQSAK
ncbi:MAG: peptidoglycan/LPS O-acetylase OafA/YrhL [Halioglobus sp.]|jgi:peptidoglycan/LPS O-acetylase OafA/YrhL